MKLFGLQITRDRSAPVAAAPRRAEPPLRGPVASAHGSEAKGLLAIGWNQMGKSSVPGLPAVSAEAAQKHGTVFACVNNIAGDHAKVPLKVWRRGDGLDERMREHPLEYLLNVESSPGVPGRVMRYALVFDYALRGNGYAYVPRDGTGEVTQIQSVPYASLHKSNGMRVYMFEDADDVQRRVPARSVAHLRYAARDGWTGRSPISVAAESMGIALASNRAAARVASGGAAKGVVKMADYYESDEDRERNARRIKEMMQSPDADGWPILGPDEDIKRLDISAADSELLASRKFDREVIAGMYRMPLFKLMTVEGGVKANSEQAALDYLTDCLLHWSALIEAQLSLALLTRREREEGLFLRHDFGALLQTTVKEQYEALSKAVGGPILTPDEARRKIGYDQTPGGDRLNPAPNMTRDSGTDQEDAEGEDA